VYVGRVLLTLIQMSSGARGAVVVVGGNEAGMVGVGVVVGEGAGDAPVVDERERSQRR
jgi:hypothetical protein